MNIRFFALAALAAGAAFGQVPVVPNPAMTDIPAGVALNDHYFQIRYASNLAIGDSVINITNDGAASTGVDMANMGFAQTGNICVHVYAYTPDEQLASCCSCFVTPNGLNSLSVRNDLASNPLTPVIPSAMVVKLLAEPAVGGASTCNAAKPLALTQGMLAWGTTLHQLPVTAGTPATTYALTETAFSAGKLSNTEFQRMTQLCGFIRANGSGYGICKSCKLGGLGASSK
jgi:hypothetical protein